ncbi:aminotransferase class I/II-fold pyridoxal phosphate-dependent enzyme [Anaeromyxobacter sp. Fw109-5]|uniref:aminotransferase class I/II-fold pyridoxal phosphate-dependent enzyme n=1 Tax=Anaeromyxobacter sp. (strain Fw109-5) TaxID=404589 RepID=UPI0000ED81FE|nr:aminotransferase class I/II-fold pyridoxal phosphate-dependent enzyme [Anaeromyxobacter sp. Fw109-5]ABS26209.1 aminotransferase class I and II [Anaeromyxobacter sp. Fw109-5]
MVVRIEDVAPVVREAQYAVRGPIVARAQELERQGREVIYCNIGNPQSLGQRPLSWVRQVLAIAEWPELLERVPAGTFAADVVAVAREVLRGSEHGLGAYTESKGYHFVREAVAAFIRDRDGIEADAEHVYLTDGASKGVQSVLRLLVTDARDGILIPIPQYPLYSATITLYGGTAIPYHLDESARWSLSLADLERSFDQARAKGIRPRAICVINPGNPTGAVLDEANVEDVLRFARERGLAVLADEVYQANVYLPGDRFVSFASVLERLGFRDVSLFSFHSVSKGFLGECGQRGGYLECRNVPAAVMDEITKLQSIALCANSAGQIVTYLLVRPPRPGEPSHATYVRERDEVLESLRRRAALLERGLSAIPGITCNPVAGAMYAFPRISLPEGATDSEWCLGLLEETGICVVPGSGFGQQPGTWHFRTTILPPVDRLEAVVERIGRFHRSFCERRAR